MRSFACMVSVLALAAAVPTLAAAESAAPPRAASIAVTPYTAAQFFETTSFSMANPDGLAFSEGRSHVLISSDKTGVFNAYALPVAGGDPVPLTASTTNATFAQSYFPDGRRVLVAADQGGKPHIARPGIVVDHDQVLRAMIDQGMDQFDGRT